MHHQVIKRVLTAFRGLPERLHEITGQMADWFASHGRPPRTSFNPTASGNKCPPLEDFYEFIDLYETGMKGAGVMLAREVALDVEAHYGEIVPYDERKLVNKCLTEHSEAMVELNSGEFNSMNLVQLQKARTELFQSIEAQTNTLNILDKLIEERFEQRERVDIYRNNFSDIQRVS